MQRTNGDTPWYLKDLIVDKEEENDEEDQIRNDEDDYDDHIEQKIQVENGVKSIAHDDDVNRIGTVRFTPFLGDEHDLVELLKNNPNSERLDKDGHCDTWLSRPLLVGVWGGGIICCFLSLIYVYKYRKRSPSENKVTFDSSGGNKCEQSGDVKDDCPKDDAKMTKAEESEEALGTSTTEGITRTTRDLEGFFRETCVNDTNQGENDKEQEKQIETLLSTDSITCSRKRDLSSFFQIDVPELAEVLSRSGLDKQESIKIVTKEVFETHRRNTEEMRRQQNKKCCQLQEEAKQACNQLLESMGTTLSGAHFLTCTILGCGVKILLSQRRTIFEYIVNEDQTLVFDLAARWISVNVCGCLEIDAADSFENAQSISIDSTTDGVWWLGFIIPHISTICSSIINVSPFYGRCLFKITGYTISLSIFHRLLRIFHCQSLHYALNLIIFFSAMVNTAFGKSVLALILQIFAFNVVECCVAFLFYMQRKEKLDILSLQKGEMELERSLTDTIRGYRQMTWRLYATSAGSAVILGLVSYVATVR